MRNLLEINKLALQAAALTYADDNWPVLPLSPNAKQPLTRNGLLDASSDREQIAEWWDRWPQANIGLRTGIVFDVLDLDGPDAIFVLNSLARNYYHVGPVASTGKGFHLYVKSTGSKNHVKLFDAPIDYRGLSGYVVAPPSVHPNGHLYLWKRSEILKRAPQWLYGALFPPARPRVIPVDDPDLRAKIEAAGDLLSLLETIAPPAIKTGNRYVTNCPFHKDDTASLSIYTDTQTFFCFGCSAWGDALNLQRYLRFGSLH